MRSDQKTGFGVDSPSKLSNGTTPTALLLLLINFALSLPVLTPGFRDIGTFDEAVYIDAARQLTNGVLPPFRPSPLTASLYALTYIPLQHSRYWLVHTCTLGRIVLFSLLWLAFYSLATCFSDISSPLTIMGILLISPALGYLVTNGNHALFTSVSAVALSQTISFYFTKRISKLWIASLLAGLMILCRFGEGTVLLFVLMAFSVGSGIVARRRNAICIALIPSIVIVGGYSLTYFVSTRSRNFGITDHLYLAFEQAQGIAYADHFSGRNAYVEGQIEARRIFGTPEENHHSVLTAISRNPVAYLHRIPRMAKSVVRDGVHVYGGPIWGFILFVLSIIGCIELFRGNHGLHLFILLCWPVYSLLYILVVFQPTDLLHPCPVIFCLASAGVNSFSTWRVKIRHYAIRIITPLLFVVLCLVITLSKTGWPSLDLKELGTAPEEKTVSFLRGAFNDGSAIGAYAPIVPFAAKMAYVGLYKSVAPEMKSENDLRRWAEDNGVVAIYSDRSLKESEPLTWRRVRLFCI